MAANPDLLAAFVRHLEDRITQLGDDLQPLEAGLMHLGHRGPGGGAWEDITQARAQRIKDEITSIRRTIERVKRDYA